MYKAHDSGRNSGSEWCTIDPRKRPDGGLEIPPGESQAEVVENDVRTTTGAWYACVRESYGVG